MSYAFRRGKRWYVAFKDASGKRVQRATSAPSRAEAQQQAQALEWAAEKARLKPVSVNAELLEALKHARAMVIAWSPSIPGLDAALAQYDAAIASAEGER